MKSQKKQRTSDDESAAWWKKRREDIKAELSKPSALRQTVTAMYGRPAAPGTFTVEAYHCDFPMPLAVMWLGFCGQTQIQINNIYTFELVRRCGLMTFLQEKLLTWYPKRSLVTGVGTKAGKAWMLANGWKKTAAGYEHPAKESHQG